MARKPLMPKATAVWLIDNTALTFEQIANFCGLHELEVQAIADGEINAAIIGDNPITSGELSQEEIKACEKDPKRQLKMLKSDLPQPTERVRGPRYTPVAKRAEKPHAILWLLKNHPELSDGQIIKLIGTTKNTIDAIRNKTHSDYMTLKPQDPVLLGLCRREDKEKAIEKALRKLEREKKLEAKSKELATDENKEDVAV